MKNYKFSRRNLLHMCKISSDGDIIFYSHTDFLVFISIVFSYASRYGIRITGLCIMFNHFHILAYAPDEDSLTLFYQQICAVFARFYNRRPGKVHIRWKRRSNISAKPSDKMKKTAYLYVVNNPVEKRYCKSASGYPWIFFGNVGYESSESISENLALAMAIVRDAARVSRPLTYEFFNHFEAVLTASEMTELRRYVISSFVQIDDSEVRKYFGSVDSFLHYSEVYSGAEYETEDDMTTECYAHYSSLARKLRSRGTWGNDLEIHSEGFDRYELIRELAFETEASNAEISRFLHLPLGLIQNITGRRF